MDKLMNQKEVKRAQILDLLKVSNISQQEASKRIGISTRQVRRLAKRYQMEGLGGLISKKRGISSNRRLDEKLHTSAITHIGTHYRDFGPTFAREKLAERHQIKLSVESTRQLMITAGYWQPRKGSKISVHPMRERRSRFGELIQIDGSPHDWFEGRSARCTLLVWLPSPASLANNSRVASRLAKRIANLRLNKSLSVASSFLRLILNGCSKLLRVTCVMVLTSLWVQKCCKNAKSSSCLFEAACLFKSGNLMPVIKPEIKSRCVSSDLSRLRLAWAATAIISSSVRTAGGKVDLALL